MPRTSRRTRSGRASEAHLSDVAKHLILPEGIVSTGWPAVQARAARMGLSFDTWQADLGRAILAKRASGLYAAGIGGVQISMPRQVGKTYTIGALVLSLCTLTPGMFALWTAHRTRTADETFGFMQALAQRADVAQYVRQIRSGNGRQELAFHNGSRLLFGARDGGFGQGFAGVDLVILDEAQILTQRALDNMVPATNTSPNPLIIRLGTPPRPSDPSDAFTEFRKSALAGDLEDGVYVEVGAPDDADPSSRTSWRLANPSYPRRTSESAILRMRRQLGEESFRREGLGIWDPEVANKAIGARVWNACTGEAVPGSRWCAAVRFSVDGSMVALARAGRPPKGGNTHVELCTRQGVRRMGEGVGWVMEWLLENQDRLAAIVIDGRSGTGDLIERLRDAGVPRKMIITPNLGEIITAHSMLDAALRDKTLTHLDDAELEAEADFVARRRIGNQGGFGWQAPEGSTCAGLDAVTLAHWAARTTKRRARGSTPTHKGVTIL